MTEKISDERLAQILDSDIGIGTVEQVGALIWQLAEEVAESRARIAEFESKVQGHQRAILDGEES